MNQLKATPAMTSSVTAEIPVVATKQRPSCTPTIRTSLNTKSQSTTPAGEKESLNDRIIHIESRIRQIENHSGKQTTIASIEDNIALLKTENSELRRSIDQLKSDLEQIQHVLLELEHVKADNEDSKKRITELSSENAALRLEVTHLKTKTTISTSPLEAYDCASHQQQQLNSNVVIRGIVQSTDVEPESVFKKIRAHLGILNDEAFNPLSVTLLQRASTQPSTTQTIQVKFESVAVKRQFLQIKRAKKEIFTSDIGIEQNTPKAILITEQLTKDNQQLLFAARSLRTTHKFKFVWSCNGQVLVRPQQNSRVTRITDIAQVNDLRATINLTPLTVGKNGRLQSSSNIEPAQSNTHP